MLVSLYNADGNWTFEKVQGAEHVRVKVPAGSELLRSRLFGLELYVPSPGERFVRYAWPARLVLDEATRPGGKFKPIHVRRTVQAL